MADIVRYEKAHASLASGLAQMAQRLKSFDLEAEGAEFVIARMASQCQKARDLAKDRRDRELEPFEPEAKRIKAHWKPLIDGFDEIFKRAKIVGQDILRRRRAEQERLRLEAQRRLEAAKKKGTPTALAKVEEAQAELDSLPPEGAPIGAKTEETTLYARKVWRWQTEDIDKVPNEYCQRLVDPRKVDFAIKNGKTSIPGLKIWQDEEMVSRRNE